MAELRRIDVRHFISLRSGISLWLCGLLLGVARAATPSEPPPADRLIDKVVDRAREVGLANDRYLYTKVSLFEELDSKGSVKTRKEKTYEVLQSRGLLRPRLVKIDGKPVSMQERLREEQEIRDRREELEDKSNKQKPKQNFTLTREVADLYQYTVTGSETFDGRMVWVVKFKPRPGAKVGGRIMDRVLARLGGTLWVDAEDFEIARAELALCERIGVLGGVIGSLDKFTLLIERRRAPEGVWYNQKTMAVIEGRKVLEQMRIRTKEESENFRAVARKN